METKESMEKDLFGYVLNKDIPDTIHHRIVYMKTHPSENLSQDDLIHHINGNHDDNRPENLKKVTAKEHAQLHAQMRGFA